MIEYCECPVPDLHFQLPNGDGVIHEDERVTIEIPNVVTHYALDRVRVHVANHVNLTSYDEKLDFLENIEPVWKTKRGNYTTRLGAAAAKNGLRLSPEVLTKVGNLIRGYDTTTTYHIEISRDFNLPATDWGRGSSCWWSFCTESRCRMKSWGGFGIRSFSEKQGGECTGRMWVLALDNKLYPTFDALHAHAYTIFNPKDSLCNPTHARLMSTLTGWPYKQITFSHKVNTRGYLWTGLKYDSGVYIVADQKTCDATESLCMDYDFHMQFKALKAVGVPETIAA